MGRCWHWAEQGERENLMGKFKLKHGGTSNLGGKQKIDHKHLLALLIIALHQTE